MAALGFQTAGKRRDKKATAKGAHPLLSEFSRTLTSFSHNSVARPHLPIKEAGKFQAAMFPANSWISFALKKDVGRHIALGPQLVLL